MCAVVHVLCVFIVWYSDDSSGLTYLDSIRKAVGCKKSGSL